MSDDLNTEISKLEEALEHESANVVNVVGTFKLLDSVVTALPATTPAQSLEKFKLQSKMCALSLKVLPDDTKKALSDNNTGSDIAVHLVRRNLISLNSLAKALYTADEAALEKDEGFGCIHHTLAEPLQLRGALISKGIDPAHHAWAAHLTVTFKSLDVLRSVPWEELREMVAPQAIGEPVSFEDEVDEAGATRLPVITRGHLEFLKVLYASGPGTPAIRKEVMDAGFGLELADELEELHVISSDQLTPTKIKALATTLIREPGLSHFEDADAIAFALRSMATQTARKAKTAPTDEEHEAAIAQLDAERERLAHTRESVREALDSIDVSDDLNTTAEELKAKIAAAKDQVAPDEEWESKIEYGSGRAALAEAEEAALSFGNNIGLGSYATNEELVASAAGGMALYGINLFPNEVDITLKPYAPILAMPDSVDMFGSSESFEASVLQSTEQSMISSFQKTASTSGISMAKSSSSSWGASASVSGWGASVSASHNSENTQGTKKSEQEENAFDKTYKTSTTTATMVETIQCPMKSFRIPATSMKLSDEATEAALKVTTLLAAGRFLDTFGSHVSNGRQLLGGLFFRTITMTSETEVNTTTLMSVAGKQLETTKSKARESSVSASGKGFGVKVKASASFGSATSSGQAEFSTEANSEGESSATSRALYQTYVSSMGPNVVTPEMFAQALFEDTSSWTIIDRGPFEALVPIAEVIADHAESEESEQLQMASELIRLAYKERAKVWKAVADTTPLMPPSLKTIILREFRQTDTQDALRASLVDLIQVEDLFAFGNTVQATEAVGLAVIATAEAAKEAPAGEHDFIAELEAKIKADAASFGVFVFPKESTSHASVKKRASQLSSSDWDGFETLWADRGANAAIQIKVDAFAEERDNAVREVIGDVSSLFHVESADATPGEIAKKVGQVIIATASSMATDPGEGGGETFYKRLQSSVDSETEDLGKFNFDGPTDPRLSLEAWSRAGELSSTAWSIFESIWNDASPIDAMENTVEQFIDAQNDQDQPGQPVQKTNRTIAVTSESTVSASTRFNISGGLQSANGKYKFVQQSDGNLVIYRNKDRKAVWATGFYSKGYKNVVSTVFSARGRVSQRKNLGNGREEEIWGAGGSGGTSITLTGNGNLKVLSGGKTYWQSYSGEGQKYRNKTGAKNLNYSTGIFGLTR